MNRPTPGCGPGGSRAFDPTDWEDVGDQFALTDSTTMCLGLVYGGLRLGAGQEILTTPHGHYATLKSLRLRAKRTGAVVREVACTTTRPGRPSTRS